MNNKPHGGTHDEDTGIGSEEPIAGAMDSISGLKTATADTVVRKRKRQRYWGVSGNDEPPVDFWLMSYADMVTLLMTVFIILVLMAGTQPGGKGGTGGEGLSGARGFLYNLFELRAMSPYADTGDYVVVAQEGATSKLTQEERQSLKIVKNEDLDRIEWRETMVGIISQKLADAHLDQYVKSEIEGEGIRVDIPDPIIFGSGVSDVDPRGMAILRALIPVLASRDFHIAVEGHTDNTPTIDYPSNWELSAGRAATVARFLVDNGIDPKRLSVVGYADTRPIMDNSTSAGRAQNRRVSILLTSPEDH